MTHSPKIWWGIAGICLTAFIAIAILSAQIFEHIPHSEDEVAYIFQASVFAQNRLTVSTPPVKDAFWSPFVVDYQGQRFGKYHPGWPLLLNLGVRIGTPWIVNALLATFTLVLIAWLGHCYYCDPHHPGTCYISIIAAGLGLVTPGFLFLSSSLLSHSASLFWTILTLVTLYYLIKAERLKFVYAILLGGSLGAAFITRPFAAFGIGSAIGIFLLIHIVQAELKWTTLFWVIVGGLPTATILPLYWWAITGDPAFNGYLLVWTYDRIGFGPDIGPEGYTVYTALFINTALKLTTLAGGLFGWPGWSNLIFIPIPFLFRRANRWDWLLLGTMLGIIIVHIFYWAFGGVDGGFPRYYYAALPAMLLLTAHGIQVTIAYLSGKKLTLPLAKRELRLHWLIIGLLVFFITYNFIWNMPPLLAAQKGKYNITPAPLRIVAQAKVPHPALILIQDVELWSDFAAPFVANSPTLDGPIVYAIDWVPHLTQQLRQLFADRSCWELHQETLQPCPPLEDQGD